MYNKTFTKIIKEVEMETSTYLITAYAQTPKNTVMFEVNRVIGVVLEIEKSDGVVVDAEAMFITDIARRFFKKLVIGTNFNEDLSGLFEDIENNYVTNSTGALIVVLKKAQQKYFAHINRNSV